MAEKNTKLSRRQFLGIAWGGSLSLLFAQGAIAFLKFIEPVTSGGFGGEIYAGKIEEFAINSINRVLKGRFYISRAEEGIIALWQKCPHLGCSVPWDEEEGQFHCSCHGSLFNEVGEVLSGPAPRPLDYFPSEIKEGEVWVDTGTPQQRSKHDSSHVTKV
ncbi:MAG: Cytochrome b6-f complex iron-sulfur subunit [Chloroflexi bacterium]|nr:Cytochrome b6-f complex iron-sulfur subunit [Chloroflexota bacterium]